MYIDRYIYIYWGLYWDHGKENRSTMVEGFRVWGLGL